MIEGTETKWKGRWEQLKAKAKQTWGDLTDDDLAVVEGNSKSSSAGLRSAPARP